MRKKIAFLLLLVSAFAAGFSAQILSASQPNLPPPAFHSPSVSQAPYVYGNPAVSLQNVEVRVVYFVPQGSSRPAAEGTFEGVRNYLSATVFPDIIAFHEREFLGHSHLTLKLYPRAVVGLHPSDFYDQDFLEVSALTPLAALETEIRSRIDRNDGDLYDADFAAPVQGHYRILLVIYNAAVPLLSLAGQNTFVPGLTNEVGTSALVFRSVVDPQFRFVWLNGETVLYHELMHTMGVPEQYDLSSIHVFEQRQKRSDVMGHGTQSPLRETFVGDDIKRGMGL